MRYHTACELWLFGIRTKRYVGFTVLQARVAWCIKENARSSAKHHQHPSDFCHQTWETRHLRTIDVVDQVPIFHHPHYNSLNHLRIEAGRRVLPVRTISAKQ